jgi:para-aminobenzoate synthetase/4-amino-4-deoxychorismate lyase
MNRRHSLPAEVYALVERSPATVLLECGRQPSQDATAPARTRLFLDPIRVYAPNTPAEFDSLFNEIENAVAAGHTAAGYFTYECGNVFEPKAHLRPLPAGQPLAWFAIYERGYLFDHSSGTFEGGEPPQLAAVRESASAKSAELRIDAEFGLTEAQYAERIEQIHEYIRAGDVYQLNFTAPVSLDVNGSIADLYAKLRVRQPVDYGAFVHADQGQYILSFSPELFFRIDPDRRITTRPMKGTARRGRTTQEDGGRAEWLRNDTKNRAENLMIVDLLRNDLGRIAKFGSVRTENMFAVERYPTLWQMTSTVTAELRPEVRYRDIFRALFPSGSITGAPKIRAMQLLSDLEDRPRGVYTGAIGMFSPQRTIFNVAIRTLQMGASRGSMGVGSGIVIDSVAAEEFSECLLKSEFLLPQKSISLPWVTLSDEFLVIETMLWDNGFSLLELHLDRLEDSAAYFDIPFDRAAAKAVIESHAESLAVGARYKIRVLLNTGGELNVNTELLASAESTAVPRLHIAPNRANSAEKWLFHKTTQRPIYVITPLQVPAKDFDEMIFLNERDEITEGTISNIFIEKNGRMLTPPVECGLLPGVFRRHLLNSLANAEERILTLEDLRTADAVFICNAVRGLRQAQIVW